MKASIVSVIACLASSEARDDLLPIARVINNDDLFSELSLNKASREARKQEALLTIEDRREIERIGDQFFSSILARPPAVPTRAFAIHYRE